MHGNARVLARVAAAGAALVATLPVTATAASGAPPARVTYTAGHVHVMPMHHPGQPLAPSCTSPCAMLYYGGPVQSNPALGVVLWSGGVDSTAASQTGSFYGKLAAANYLAQLDEYDTTGLNGQDGNPGSNQHISPDVAYDGTFTITPSVCNGASACTLYDSDIQANLATQIGNGTLLPASGERDYTVLFPPNVVVCQNSTQCSNNFFCAYHGTFLMGSTPVVYQVIPDESGAPAGACGPSSYYNNLNSAISHELVETITDTDVGLTSTLQRPVAWSNYPNGEIGDPCNQQEFTQTLYGVTFTVQKWWSNVAGGCIAPSGLVPNATPVAVPSSQTVAPGASAPYTIEFTNNHAGSENVTLSVSGLPSGVTGSFSPNPVSSSSTSTLTLAAGSGVAGGTYPFTVTSTGQYSVESTGATLVVQAASTNPFVNASFQDGNLTGWSHSGTVAIGSGGDTGDSYVVVVGKTTGPSTTSTVSQTVTVPSGDTYLHFWFWGVCQDKASGDYLAATVRDITASTSKHLAHTCVKSTAWSQANIPVVAGHRIKLTLINHDDNDSGASSYSYFDNVWVDSSATARSAAAPLAARTV